MKMILFGILSIIAGIISLLFTIREPIRWNSPLALKFRGWIISLGLIYLGIMILYENL